ncbi:hypothetical protein CLV49_1352 [Labedella gwakjiensis]|uniref:Uncharacterized protein n=1 Tax=Labedella gwakjiensis TaxID=390269 RepID=A0A2P8GUW8_9MICO|nr:hypothetical protein [Labedella gwakjiensis]PSL37745.1 hypothetical protein CLV49_1352 [Labedella gwakjiensis]
MIAFLEMLARFVAAAFETVVSTSPVVAALASSFAPSTVSALIALLGVIALAGGAAVAVRAVVRLVAALLDGVPTERSDRPAPAPFLRTQDDPTAEGHPRPRAPGRRVPVAVR